MKKCLHFVNINIIETRGRYLYEHKSIFPISDIYDIYYFLRPQNKPRNSCYAFSFLNCLTEPTSARSLRLHFYLLAEEHICRVFIRIRNKHKSDFLIVIHSIIVQSVLRCQDHLSVCCVELHFTYLTSSGALHNMPAY